MNFHYNIKQKTKKNANYIFDNIIVIDYSYFNITLLYFLLILTPITNDFEDLYSNYCLLIINMLYYLNNLQTLFIFIKIL